ncbi:RING-box protein 1a [Hibiscus syriacus]|uniref:RING-box protein 1a n=1 Tax=Hibiscus syriacus TaxID=106335 RepID=A0A6A2YV90_HIBSY|nr:RING-box protein 1a [Hibiscus syriacus]
MATLDSDVPMIPAGEASSSTAPSSSSKKPKRLEIKKWSAVGFGLGILSWIIVKFAGITSWTFLTKPAPPARNALLLGIDGAN